MSAPPTPLGSQCSTSDDETQSMVSSSDDLSIFQPSDVVSSENFIVEQLQALHQQFAALRGEISSSFSATSGHFTDVTDQANTSRVIVCCVRRPVKLRQAPDGNWIYTASQGGFKSAIDSLSGSFDVKWVSWPGSAVDESAREGICKRLETEYQMTPVFLSQDLIDSFFHKFCGQYLWPLLHGLNEAFSSMPVVDLAEQFDAYIAANRVFADTVCDMYEPGDTILVHDFHLLLLPQLLRQKLSKANIAFTLHCPFPSSELYRCAPMRTQLLQGMLGANLVCFQTFDYLRCFTAACTHILGYEANPSHVEADGRLVNLLVTPMGIDVSTFDLQAADVASELELLKAHYKGIRLIVGMDRLDTCKGIPLKLSAMETFLKRYKEWRGKVVLIEVVRDSGRSRSAHFKQLSRTVNQLVGQVNGRYGTADYTPVRIVKSSLSRSQLIALYSIADVALISSVSEGINLAAQEFVACQPQGQEGVLLYSEFAGCARLLKGALVVNPFNTEAVSDAIHNALRMSPLECQVRHRQLMRFVQKYTASAWAHKVMSSVSIAADTDQRQSRVPHLDSKAVMHSYSRSKRRLIVLDYDGTVAPFQPLLELARPSSELLDLFACLLRDPRNTVVIISGHRHDTLQAWFADLPVGLAAEYGFMVRMPPSNKQAQVEAAQSFFEATAPLQIDTVIEPQIHCSEAHPEQSGAETALSLAWQFDAPQERVTSDASFEDHIRQSTWGAHWKHASINSRDLEEALQEAADIMEYFVERTPGSVVAKKSASLSWNFINADPEFGFTQAKDLQLLLEQTMFRAPVSVLLCPVKKYVVVRHMSLGKGNTLCRILQELQQKPAALQGDNERMGSDAFDFVFCAGDERTDEDMFHYITGDNQLPLTFDTLPLQVFVHCWQEADFGDVLRGFI